ELYGNADRRSVVRVNDAEHAAGPDCLVRVVQAAGRSLAAVSLAPNGRVQRIPHLRSGFALPGEDPCPPDQAASGAVFQGPGAVAEIGRASCRERGEMQV